jgi:large subunit ribosomal protein L6
MSRTGRKPITVPQGVDVKIDGNLVTVKGKLGTLSQSFNPDMAIVLEDGVINVRRPSDEKEHRSLHGLTRTLLDNMVVGVSAGFTKELEINGVGYRAQKQGKDLVMNLGYSHQIVMPEIEGITVEVPSPNKVIIKGPDKQKVGQFAAEVRGKRPPEPYKGKGVKYVGEVIIRKEGKAGKGKK